MPFSRLTGRSLLLALLFTGLATFRLFIRQVVKKINNRFCLGFPVFQFLLFKGSYGVIELGEYDNDQRHDWHVDSDCSSIHLVSTHFDIEGCCDLLTIAGLEFSGSPVINRVIEGSSFVATFTSDGSVTRSGFTILWSCYVPTTRPPQPGMDCATYGFCLMRGPSPAKWHEAQNYCEAHNLALPHPRYSSSIL